ncbi:hypothetical protein [Carnobacterium maltaromaticum]|uniref:hypothetical protein n=1 Tax=Carnobacterium maltaromaticum TaxID=2751 RepID=UPI0012FCF2FB|nr:hypothetical protein [Carnobacterium maltaromaticum]
MALYYFQPDGFVVKGTKNECGFDQNLNKIKRFTENHNGLFKLVSKGNNEAIIRISGAIGLVFEKIVNEKENEINEKQYKLFSEAN